MKIYDNFGRLVATGGTVHKGIRVYTTGSGILGTPRIADRDGDTIITADKFVSDKLGNESATTISAEDTDPDEIQMFAAGLGKMSVTKNAILLNSSSIENADIMHGKKYFPDTIAHGRMIVNPLIDTRTVNLGWGNFNRPDALEGAPAALWVRADGDPDDTVGRVSATGKYSTSEFIKNGYFAGNADFWIVGSNWSYGSNGVTHSAGSTNDLEQIINNYGPYTYTVIFTISGYSAGSVRVWIGNASEVAGTARSADGTYTEQITAVDNQLGSPTPTVRYLTFRPSSDFVGKISAVSIQTNMLGPHVVRNVRHRASDEDGNVVMATEFEHNFIQGDPIVIKGYKESARTDRGQAVIFNDKVYKIIDTGLSGTMHTYTINITGSALDFDDSQLTYESYGEKDQGFALSYTNPFSYIHGVVTTAYKDPNRGLDADDRFQGEIPLLSDINIITRASGAVDNGDVNYDNLQIVTGSKSWSNIDVHYRVQIDGEDQGDPASDTYKYQINGGSWTTGQRCVDALGDGVAIGTDSVYFKFINSTGMKTGDYWLYSTYKRRVKNWDIESYKTRVSASHTVAYSAGLELNTPVEVTGGFAPALLSVRPPAAQFVRGASGYSPMVTTNWEGGVTFAEQNEITTGATIPDQDVTGYGSLYLDGADNKLKFRNEDGDIFTMLLVDSSGRFGIGTTSPAYSLDIVSSDANEAAVQVTQYQDSATDASNLLFKRARGSESSPTVLQDDDDIGSVTFYGYDGANFEDAGEIRCEVDGEPATGGDTTDMPGRLVFKTTADGSDSMAERMRIDSNGDIGIGATSNGMRLYVQDAVADFVVQVHNAGGGTGDDGVKISFSSAGDMSTSSHFLYVVDGSADVHIDITGNGSGGYSIGSSFTAGHDTACVFDDDMVPGLIVESTGEIW